MPTRLSFTEFWSGYDARYGFYSLLAPIDLKVGLICVLADCFLTSSGVKYTLGGVSAYRLGACFILPVVNSTDRPQDMNVDSILSTGLQGMQQSQRNLGSAATEIAQAATLERPSESSRSLAQPLVEMKFDQHVFDASAKVVSTADELLGTLLDTKA